MISWFTGLDTIVRRVLVVAVIVLLLVVIGLTVGYCRSRDDAKEADANSTLSDARTEAAKDASAIRDAADERIKEINDAVKDATDEVRNEADPVARNRAARVGVCRIDPSSSPDCGLLLANP